MKNMVLVNPLQTGKLEECKAFMTEITTTRKAEYSDMLNRYGLKTSKVYYHKLNGTEFFVVFHEIENYAAERIANWPTSTHPFYLWFKEQAQQFYDFASAKISGQPHLLIEFCAN